MNFKVEIQVINFFSNFQSIQYFDLKFFYFNLTLPDYWKKVITYFYMSDSSLFVKRYLIRKILFKHFFFMIKTDGSWLDIGTSISHYAISMIPILFIPIIFYIAQFLFTLKLSKDNKKKAF